MQMVTDHVRWCATDAEPPVLAWCADRSTIGTGSCGRHLAPLASVGRLSDGCLAVDVLRPSGTPLSAALDTIGRLTTGVAVTLSVPLLELVVAERSGAVQIGAAALDDVLVDDAGAVVLCDRPPAAQPSVDTEDTPRASTSRSAAPGGSGVQPGDRILVLAARVVWERTDARDPGRGRTDVALAEALDGGVASARAALSAVRATAAPRPVRWDPPSDDLLGAYDAPGAVGPGAVGPGAWRTSMAGTDGQVVPALVRVFRDALEHGVPIGGGRRVPLRRLVVGLVVAAGLTAAAVFALG